MFNLSRGTWFSITMFPLGMLLGAGGIAYLLVSELPLPHAAQIIAWSGLFSPVCIILLLVSRVFTSARILLAPLLLIAGLAVPMDFAFACLLGWLNEPMLRGAIGLIFLLAAGLIAIPVNISRRSMNAEAKTPDQRPNADGKLAGANHP